MRLRNLGIALAMLVLGAPTQVRADTFFVPGDYPTIQAAIDVSEDEDEIVILPGTYFETLFLRRKSVTLRSVDPDDPSIVASTIVDGNQAGCVVTIEANTSFAQVLGLTLQHGECYRGGGVSVDSFSEVVMSRSRIVGNVTQYYGSGVWVKDSILTLDRCEVSANGDSSMIGGGGAAVEAEYSTLNILSCEIVDNDCLGLNAHSRGRTHVEHTTISRNGGGAHFSDSLFVTHCRFEDNQGSPYRDGVGGISLYNGRGVIQNSIIARNSAPLGAGVNTDYSTLAPLIDQCTIVDNVAFGFYQYGGGVFIDPADSTQTILRNCIVAGNQPDQLYQDKPTAPKVRYSLIESGWPGEGNIDADPEFRSYDGFDYVLTPGSPCVDAGDPAVEDGVSDWHPRWPARYPNGPRSDMGAYGGPFNADWLR